MNPSLSDSEIPKDMPPKKGNGFKIAFFILLALILVLGVSGVLLYKSVFPSRFTPVELSNKEQVKLDQKIERLEGSGEKREIQKYQSNQAGSVLQDFEPEQYVETAANRDIRFTEKELNAFLTGNGDLAERLAIDLTDNLASAKLLVPVDPDAPLLGGKTIKVTAGLELAFRNNQPVVVLKGVSIWGVPIPNAWLGNIKNVDLVKEFGSDTGFWKSFADGIELVEVTEGHLRIVLKE